MSNRDLIRFLLAAVGGASMFYELCVESTKTAVILTLIGGISLISVGHNFKMNFESDSEAVIWAVVVPTSQILISCIFFWTQDFASSIYALAAAICYISRASDNGDFA